MAQTTQTPPPQTAETFHEGRPSVDASSGRIIIVKCSHGHLYAATPVRDWPGSYLEAKCGDPAWTVRCHGTIAAVSR